MARLKAPKSTLAATKIKAAKALRAARPAVKGPAVVRPSASQRDRARALIADIRDRETRVLRNFYQMGLSLKKLSDPQMYESLEYPSFVALLRGEQLMSRGRAYKLIQVVEAYSAKQALALGFERAYGLVEWARHAATEERPAELAKRDVEIAGRPVSKVSVRKLKNETKRLRKRASTPGVDRALVRAEEVAARVEQMLRRRGAKNPHASPVRERGKWRIQAVFDVDDAVAWVE